MKEPQLTPIRKDDLGIIPGWMDKVIYAFNRLVDSIKEALRNGLTIGENLRGQIFAIQIYPSDIPYKVAAKFPITDLWVTAIYDVSGSRVDFISPVWVDWVYDASNLNVVIYNISGLTVGHQYRIRLVGLSE